MEINVSQSALKGVAGRAFGARICDECLLLVKLML